MKYLYRFKKAYESPEIASILRDYDISEHNIDQIIDRLDYRLYFYDDGVTHPKLSIMERLSIIPLYIVLFIMLTVIMPIKWIFTGKYRFESEKPKWLWKWITKFY